MDLYFRRPLLWDYLIAFGIAGTAYYLYNNKYFTLPKAEFLFSFVSDLSTIGLTLAGFILTLMTVLIATKSSVKKIRPDQKIKESDSVYDIFFSTHLYFDTIKHLKNAIKSLIIVALAGYVLKLTVNTLNYDKLFLYNYFGVTILVLTLWRCLLILSRIIKLQEQG